MSTPWMPLDMRQYLDFDQWLKRQPGVQVCKGLGPDPQWGRDSQLHGNCCIRPHLVRLPDDRDIASYLEEWALLQHPSLVRFVAEHCLDEQRRWSTKAAAELDRRGTVPDFTAYCLTTWRANRRFWLGLARTTA